MNNKYNTFSFWYNRRVLALCSIGDIKINLKLKDVYINGDSELLEQAITNILTNAIKYSQSEVIDIELTTISGFAQIII